MQWGCVTHFFTLPIPNSNAKKCFRNTILDSQTKSQNHLCLFVEGAVCLRVFFQNASPVIYIRAGNFPRKKSDYPPPPKKKKNNKLHNKLGTKPQPRGVLFRPIRRRYRDENRPPPKHDSHVEVVVLPRSSQGTNYLLRGQAHVNPEARSTLQGTFCPYPTKQESSENHRLKSDFSWGYDVSSQEGGITHCLAGIFFLMVFLLCFTHRTFSHDLNITSYLIQIGCLIMFHV